MLSIVLLRELTSLKDRNGHGLEVIRPDEMNLQRWLKMRWWFGSPFNQEAHIPAAFMQGRLGHQAGRPYTGQAPQLVPQRLAKKNLLFIGLILLFRQTEAKRQDFV